MKDHHRRMYLLELTRLEVEIILEALRGYSEYVRNMAEFDYSEPERLAKEIEGLLKDAKQDN